MATLVVSSPTHESRHAAGGADALPWGTIHGSGTNAARPTAGANNAGYLYFQTDSTQGLYRSDGTGWTLIADLTPVATGSVAGTVTLAGDLGGTSTSPLVTGIHGTTVPASTTASTYLKTTGAGAAVWTAISAVDNGDGTATLTY